jgi:hypothetical protein
MLYPGVGMLNWRMASLFIWMKIVVGIGEVQQKIHILSSFQSSRETSMIKAW